MANHTRQASLHQRGPRQKSLRWGAAGAVLTSLAMLALAAPAAATGAGPHFESAWRSCSKAYPRRAFRGRAATIRHFNAVDACTRQRGGFSG